MLNNLTIGDLNFWHECIKDIENAKAKSEEKYLKSLQNRR